MIHFIASDFSNKARIIFRYTCGRLYCCVYFAFLTPINIIIAKSLRIKCKFNLVTTTERTEIVEITEF